MASGINLFAVNQPYRFEHPYLHSFVMSDQLDESRKDFMSPKGSLEKALTTSIEGWSRARSLARIARIGLETRS